MTLLRRLASGWRRLRRARRARIIIGAVLVGTIAGAVDLGQPLDDALNATRAIARRHAPDDSIIVIDIDDRTLGVAGVGDVSRQQDAQLLDRLFAAGARRVFFDRTFAYREAPADDNALLDELRRHPGQVFFGATNASSDPEGADLSIVPNAMFRDHVGTVALTRYWHPFGFAYSYPYSATINGRPIASLSAELAGRPAPRGDFFDIDMSIDVSKIPTVSYIDALHGRINPQKFAGRDVVIALGSQNFKDNRPVPFQQVTTGAHLHVMAAHTLREGAPRQLGFVPALLLVSSLLFTTIGRGIRLRLTYVATMVATLLLAPLALDAMKIEVDVVAAMLALAIAVFRARTLDQVEQASEVNAASGLPSFRVLRKNQTAPQNLVALKVRNYAIISGSFDRPVEADLAGAIVRRIRIGDPDAVIYHEGDMLVWLSRLNDTAYLTEHLEGLHRIVRNGIDIDGRNIDLSFTFGIDSNRDMAIAARIANALQSADEAARTDHIVCIHKAREHEVEWEVSLLSSLDRAMDTGEVWVAYQPKFDLAAGKICGAEALVRWNHPERGAIPPDEFVKMAEMHHRIERLTAFVLDEAAHAAATLVDAGHDFSVSVNISAQLLQDPDLPSLVLGALSRNGLAPERMILEITETDRLDRNSTTVRMLERLVECGVELSIDDFGTGNATIDYLRFLPAGEVKVDKIFVMGMEANEQDRVLVRSIINMAHSLKRRVVAEGVENEAIMEALRRMKCDILQGYHISRPVRFAEMRELIEVPALVKTG